MLRQDRHIDSEPDDGPRIWTGGRHLTVTGRGYEPLGDFLHNSSRIEPGSDASLLNTLRAAALCNDAILSTTDTGYQILGDPTEGALLSAAGKAGLSKKELEANHPRLGRFLSRANSSSWQRCMRRAIARVYVKAQWSGSWHVRPRAHLPGREGPR